MTARFVSARTLGAALALVALGLLTAAAFAGYADPDAQRMLVTLMSFCTARP